MLETLRILLVDLILYSPGFRDFVAAFIAFNWWAAVLTVMFLIMVILLSNIDEEV
jgi:hypothetical protein